MIKHDYLDGSAQMIFELAFVHRAVDLVFVFLWKLCDIPSRYT